MSPSPISVKSDCLRGGILEYVVEIGYENVQGGGAVWVVCLHCFDTERIRFTNSAGSIGA